MLPVIATTSGNSENAPAAPIDHQLFLLETLKLLLDGAVRCLSGGDALPLLEMSRQISSTAQELVALCLQLAHFPVAAEAHQRRRKLLVEVGQQRAFCRAMLRRWRRSIALRQQLLALGGEPVPYTDSLYEQERP